MSTHLRADGALAHVAHPAMQEGRAAQLHRHVGHRVVVRRALAQALVVVVRAGVPLLLPVALLVGDVPAAHFVLGACEKKEETELK